MIRFQRWTSRLIATLALAALPFPQGLAQEGVLVDIDDLSPHELRTRGFALNAEQDLRIQAVGARGWERWGRGQGWRGWRGGQGWEDWDRYWVGNAWILDARTREVVWELRYAETESRSGDLETFEGDLRLPAGEYIVRYASYSGERESNRWEDGWRDEDASPEWYDDGLSEDFRITIQGSGRTLTDRDIARARDAFTRDAFVSFIGLEDGVKEWIGFRIDQPTDVEIYAMGEATDGGSYDYAWLIDTDARKPVWKLEERGSMRAGGARKNRIVHKALTLEPGSYAVVVVTDDSHDTRDWNAAPPYDPEFWGVMIQTADPLDRSRVQTFAYEPTALQNAFVSLTGVGDQDVVSQGFSLSREMDVRVYAIGEGIDGMMYDFGRIVYASTQRAVWQMDYYETEHAGGAEKNRMVDEVVTLAAGNYVVYYATDGSHSSYEWNSAPPLDETAWGITLASAAGPIDRGVVGSYDPGSDPSVIAQLTEIRDSERRRQHFTLDRETEVRVYALGEGSRGDMYDFAWIVSDGTGRAVWEMTYRNTERAGGARKNRRFDDTIRLPAGDYTLRYQSDGSHSFGDWNAAPPADPFNYGVTLYRADG